MKSFSYLSILVYLTIIFKPIFIFVQFELNKEYMIARYCVNVDKPELNCNGNCHLKTEIEKSLEFPEDTNIALKAQYTELPVLLAERLDLDFPQLKEIGEVRLFYQNHYSFKLVNSIFRPPKILS